MAKRNRIIDRAKDTYESTKERLGEAKERSEKVIQDHPFTSIIIAAAVGALVAVVTTKMLRPRKRSLRRRLRDYL